MLTAFAEVLFPAVCPGCGARGEPLCVACGSTIRSAPSVPPPAGLDALHVPYAYAGVVRELIARAKYRRRHAALAWLATAMVAELGATPPAVDIVTWAPTTVTRRRTRGFDQAEVLATSVAGALRRPSRATLLRVGDGHQTGRSRAQRMDAPEFTMRTACPVAGRRVLVVDDVVTTGATLRAAATVLRRAGAVSVVGLAAARRA